MWRNTRILISLLIKINSENDLFLSHLYGNWSHMSHVLGLWPHLLEAEAKLPQRLCAVFPFLMSHPYLTSPVFCLILKKKLIPVQSNTICGNLIW